MYIIINKDKMIVSACDYTPDVDALTEHECTAIEIDDSDYSIDMVGAIYDGD